MQVKIFLYGVIVGIGVVITWLIGLIRTTNTVTFEADFDVEEDNG